MSSLPQVFEDVNEVDDDGDDDSVLFGAGLEPGELVGIAVDESDPVLGPRRISAKSLVNTTA